MRTFFSSVDTLSCLLIIIVFLFHSHLPDENDNEIPGKEVSVPVKPAK